ncbi:alpha/beta hydrolase [Rhodanobacter sp. Root561]|uniref:alpha/beta fold hydrolase n=1 Tax=Rhodanobacter sp. Root561 TaxID=1736560 RepID=UPI0006F69CA0|nr:alpha/beta hydrolase [Rhodanobacter sp. Root561]KQZ69170.1 alpha/beta hydrolase [Rhodanobacter sp. Root561]
MKFLSQRLINPLAGWLVLGALALAMPLAASARNAPAPKPTVVLVHGAFADSSSWNGVIKRLHDKGYTVIAAANELRSVNGDAVAVTSLVKSIHGPVVLVGHSYGGPVISVAATGQDNVKALVYVAAFAPEVGENAAELSGRFPGSSLGSALAPPVELADGGKDLYIEQDKFHAQFAADVPAAQASLMAVGQRPVTDAALHEASTSAAWKSIPSWFIYGSADLNIPPAAQAFMAKRAHSRKTVVIKGASHVVMVSHPAEVAALIEQAAQAR